jgi:hypothetical protein
MVEYHYLAYPSPTRQNIDVFPRRFRIDVSDNERFINFALLADHTEAEYIRSGVLTEVFEGKGIKERYVRITATQLMKRMGEDAPYVSGLAGMEVYSSGANIALNQPLNAKDSVERGNYGITYLNDGLGLVDPIQDEIGYGTLRFRKDVRLDKTEVMSATAYICGLGYYELFIDGEKVGDHVLDYGFTDYNKKVQYVTYDVTDYFNKGENAVGVELAGSIYDMKIPDLFGFERAQWSAPPKFILNIVLEFEDNRKMTIVSDPSWRWSTGPVTFTGIRSGETYDSGRQRPGWNE